MSGLKELQVAFQDGLLQKDNQFAREICSSAHLGAQKRLDIYLDAYQSRLVEALAANYPKLQQYVGKVQFRDLALAYIENYPSTYKSIRWYGEHLEQFLALHPALGDMPYLAEMAKFEWHMTLVFDGKNSDAIDESAVMALQPEQWLGMRLVFLPTLYLLDFKWNIIPIWKSLEHNEKPPQPQLLEQTQRCVFWRGDLINQFCTIDEIEACALKGFIDGYEFLEVSELLEQFMPIEEAAAYLAALLKGWLGAGLVTDIKVVPGES